MKEMFNNLKGGNPQEIITKMFGDNPAMQAAMGNPEQAVRNMLQQQGIDVDVFMNAIKNSLA